MSRTAGFARVEHRATLANSACVACYRKWPVRGDEGAAAVELVDAIHHTNFGINFSSRADDYVGAVFRTEADGLTPGNVEPEVDGYGVRPVSVTKLRDGRWQANFLLPPGLEAGWRDARVRIAGGSWSNKLPIAVDLGVEAASEISITGVADDATWETGIYRAAGAPSLAVWVAGLPDNADRANVRVLLDGRRLEIVYVGSGIAPGARQINARVPAGVAAGTFPVEVRAGGKTAFARISIEL